MTFNMQRRGMTGALADFAKAAAVDSVTQQLAVRKAGALIEAAWKGNATGRPGPRVVTGNFRRSINTEDVDIPGTESAVSVGTNAPQGARLEFGFVGRDALGRNYNQKPYPSLEPAIQSKGEEALDIIENAFFGFLS